MSNIATFGGLYGFRLGGCSVSRRWLPGGTGGR